ncbi:MAG: GGDEF domain-containing protein [Thiohalomonadales bacterium]
MKIQTIKPRDYKIHSPEIRSLIEILQPLLGEEESERQLFEQIQDLLTDLDFSHIHSEYAYLSFLILLFQAIMSQIPAHAEIVDQLALLQQQLEPPLDLLSVDVLYQSVETVAKELQQVGVLSIEQASMIMSPILLEYSNARKQAKLREAAAIQVELNTRSSPSPTDIAADEPTDKGVESSAVGESRRIMGGTSSIRDEASYIDPQASDTHSNIRTTSDIDKATDDSDLRRVLGKNRKSTSKLATEQPVDIIVQGDELKDYHRLVQGLQKDFISKTRIAVTQIGAFSEQLKLEIDAIKAMTRIDDIEQYRQKVIFTMESLQAQHNQLAENFDTARSYLSVISSGNQKLMDELDRVRLLSLTDELTGLPNRRAFLRRLHYEVSRVKRYRNPITLVILDLDHFKSINDKYGHQGGDEVLKMYTNKVFSLFRHHDSVARYGGEEFVMLFPDTNLVGVSNALNKIQEKCKTMRVHVDNVEFPLPSFSAGVVEYQQGESAEHFVARADKELYRAKRGGRSRVEYEQVEKPIASEPLENESIKNTPKEKAHQKENLTNLDPNLF